MTFIRIIIIYKTTFIPVVAVCTRQCIIYVQLFFIHNYNLHIYTRGSLCSFPNFPLLPLLSLSYPFCTLFHLLAPSSCDRNRPPSSQVACKLTLFAPPPFTHLSHPPQLPITPTAQRQTMTTLGPLRSGYAEHSLPKVGVGC